MNAARSETTKDFSETSPKPGTPPIQYHLLPSDKIRPNKIRDLHMTIKDDMTDTEFRKAVMEWLKDVTYAE